MGNKPNNIVFYSGMVLLFIGALGLTFFAFFAVIGLPVFIVGLILLLVSKKTWKLKIITSVISIVGVIAFWPIWRFVNNVGPEKFLIPENYRGQVNIIYGRTCGVLLKRTTEGLVYKIPDDGVLILSNEQKYGFIDHEYFLLDGNGNRVALPKMDVRDFNEAWTLEKNPNEPPRDKLGIFHWGTTGSIGKMTDKNGIETNKDDQYTYQEFYVSTYRDLSEKFGYVYGRKFDSIRDRKVKTCSEASLPISY